MFRRLVVGFAALDAVTAATSRRNIATSMFVNRAAQLHKEFASSSKKRELQAEGRQLFERELLDDALSGGLDDAAISTIVAAASALRIVPTAGQIYRQVMSHALKPEVIASLEGATIARLMHASLVLCDPQLFELLFAYIHRVIEVAPSLNGVSCAMIINAYGRSGVRHELLYKKLCQRAVKALKDDTVTIAHIANVAHALSRVGVAEKAVFLVLKDQSIKLGRQAVPLVMATILDAFATVGIIDVELFELYENNLRKAADELTAPLVTTVLLTLVTAKRSSSPLFTTCTQCASKLSHTFDASSISKCCDALLRANQPSEDLFGAMAERASKIVSDFRADEIRITLHALSKFDLFDAELFPLLASRLVHIVKSGKGFEASDLVSVLMSFAVVHERNEELIHVCSGAIRNYVDALPPAVFTDLMWAMGELNVRNELTRALTAHLAQNPSKLSKTYDATRLHTIRTAFALKE